LHPDGQAIKRSAPFEKLLKFSHQLVIQKVARLQKA